MADYTKNRDYAIKDGLSTGDPLKVIRGTELDEEFDEIAASTADKAERVNGTHTGNTSIDNIVLGTAIDGGAIDGGSY